MISGGGAEPSSNTITNRSSHASGTSPEGTTIYLRASKEAEEDHMMALFLILVDAAVKIGVTVYFVRHVAKALRGTKTEHLTLVRG